MTINDRNIQVRNLVLAALAKEGIKVVPAAISNHHVHLSRSDLDALFGVGYLLKPLKELSQPDQYACEEKIKVVGPKGAIADVRVLGPERKQTQVEVSVTDSFTLGIKPFVRNSGDIQRTPGIQLIGPCGSVVLKEGVIVSARHIHMSDIEAAAYGLKTGDMISVKKCGMRPTVLENVLVRAGKGHSLEVHLDLDEGNAALIDTGDLLEVIDSLNVGTQDIIKASNNHSTSFLDEISLLTEEVLENYACQGIRTVMLNKGAKITPLAKDLAWEKKINIEYYS